MNPFSKAKNSPNARFFVDVKMAKVDLVPVLAQCGNDCAGRLAGVVIMTQIRGISFAPVLVR